MRTGIVDPALVRRVLLERLSSLFNHDLPDGTRKEEREAEVLHPVGGERVGLSAGNLVDKDEGVDGVQETVVGGYTGGHSGGKGRFIDEEGPVDLGKGG